MTVNVGIQSNVPESCMTANLLPACRGLNVHCCAVAMCCKQWKLILHDEGLHIVQQAARLEMVFFAMQVLLQLCHSSAVRPLEGQGGPEMQRHQPLRHPGGGGKNSPSQPWSSCLMDEVSALL